jgi:uncharacterized protein
MTEIFPPHAAAFMIATFAGAVVAGLSGFAFGLVASAIWLHFITPAESAPLIASFAIVLQGWAVWRLRHAIALRPLVPLLAGGALGVPMGVAALRWLSASQLHVIVGAVSMTVGIYGLARPRLEPVKGGAPASLLVGMASGILGGSTGLGGIPTTIWTTLKGGSKAEQRAVFQPVTLGIFILTLAGFGGVGIITAETARLFLLGLPPLLIGSWLGLKLYDRFDDAAFQKAVLMLLLVSGLALMF